MIDTQKDFRKKVFGVTLAIMAVAMVLSVGTKALAQTADEGAVPADSAAAIAEATAGDTTVESLFLSGAEAAAANEADGGTGLDRVIVGTEKWGEEHSISVSRFLQNIVKSTGIYQIATQKRVAPNDSGFKDKIEEAPEKDWGTAPGWQSLIMIAIGFLIVYLAVGKGFEPLLLIPIGFGTILVNIVGASMGDLPDGMLAIIYHAGVGNEFFPMLIFMGIGAMTDFGPLIANPKTAISKHFKKEFRF